MPGILGLHLTKDEVESVLSVPSKKIALKDDGLYALVIPYRALVSTVSTLSQLHRSGKVELDGTYSRDDYNHLPWNRTLLNEIWERVGERGRNDMLRLIQRSDRVLARILVGGDLIGLPFHEGSVDPQVHWWLFGKPIVVQ